MDTVQRVRLSFANTWVVKGDSGYMVIDSGPPVKIESFIDKIKDLKIEPGQVKMALSTHVHFDHVGNTAALKKSLGCLAAVPEKEACFIDEGGMEMPGGLTPFTRAAIWLANNAPERLVKKIMYYKPFSPDILLTPPMGLEKFGFEAKVLATPGHTKGSVSVITSQGDALVGDLAFNDHAWLRRTVLPMFASCVKDVYESWKILLENNARVIHPGHGPAFDAALLEKTMKEHPA